MTLDTFQKRARGLITDFTGLVVDGVIAEDATGDRVHYMALMAALRNLDALVAVTGRADIVRTQWSNTPRGLTDAEYLLMYQNALEQVRDGNAERIEDVLHDWAPSHIDNYARMNERAPRVASNLPAPPVVGRCYLLSGSGNMGIFRATGTEQDTVILHEHNGDLWLEYHVSGPKAGHAYVGGCDLRYAFTQMTEVRT